jgi:hypothetical protein
VTTKYGGPLGISFQAREWPVQLPGKKDAQRTGRSTVRLNIESKRKCQSPSVHHQTMGAPVESLVNSVKTSLRMVGSLVKYHRARCAFRMHALFCVCLFILQCWRLNSEPWEC